MSKMCACVRGVVKRAELMGEATVYEVYLMSQEPAVFTAIHLLGRHLC